MVCFGICLLVICGGWCVGGWVFRWFAACLGGFLVIAFWVLGFWVFGFVVWWFVRLGLLVWCVGVSWVSYGLC